MDAPFIKSGIEKAVEEVEMYRAVHIGVLAICLLVTTAGDATFAEELERTQFYFDASMKQAEYAFNSFDTRRQYE